MVYQISGHDSGDWEDMPSSLHLFWSTSHAGQYLDAFKGGYEAGKADLEAGTAVTLDELLSIEASFRNLAWEARRDGYNDATRSRGPNGHG